MRRYRLAVFGHLDEFDPVDSSTFGASS